MKSIDAFKKFYKDSLVPKLKELEVRRKKVQKYRQILLIFIVLILGLHGGIILLKFAPLWSLIISTVVVAVSFAFFYKRFVDDPEIMTTLRSFVISDLLSFALEKPSVEPENYISYDYFRKSKLFMLKADHYLGNGMVKSKEKNTQITFSNIEASYHANHSQKRQERWQIIFRGFFIVAENKSKFDGNIFIVPNKLENNLGILGSKIKDYDFNMGRGIVVRNNIFSQHYAFFADKTLETLKIFSDDILQDLCDFKDRTGLDLHISCIGNTVFLALNAPESLFSFSLNRSLLDFAYFTKLYKEIGFVIDLSLKISANLEK